MRNERGSVLIVMLWLVTILGITAAALAYGRRTAIAVTRNRMNQTKVYAVARGGVELVVAGLHSHGSDKSHTPAMDWWSASSRYKKVEVGDGWFSVYPMFDSEAAISAPGSNGSEYGISDEESKFNVNTASEEMLAKLPCISPELAKAIVDKRKVLLGEKKTSSSLVTTLAEAREEKEAEKNPVVNKPFRDLGDLLSVSGVTAKMLYGDGKKDKGASKFITARSSGRVNVNSAPKEVILALGVKEDAYKTVESKRSSGKGFQKVDVFLEASGLLAQLQEEQAGNADGSSSGSSSGDKNSGEGSENKKLTELKKILTVHSSNFKFVSVGNIAGCARVAIYATVFLGSEKVQVYSWHYKYLPPPEKENESGADTAKPNN